MTLLLLLYVVLQELVGSKKKLNWKKIGIIGGVALVIVIIIVTVVLVTGGNDDDDDNNGGNPISPENQLTLDDILTGRFSAKRFNGTWISDKEILYRDASGTNVIGYNVETGVERVLLNNDVQELSEGFQFDVSADGKFLLVAREHQKVRLPNFVIVYIRINPFMTLFFFSFL